MLILTNKAINAIFNNENGGTIDLFRPKSMQDDEKDKDGKKTGRKLAGASIANITGNETLSGFDRLIYFALCTIMRDYGINKPFSISKIYRLITGKNKGSIDVNSGFRKKFFKSLQVLQGVKFTFYDLYQDKQRNSERQNGNNVALIEYILIQRQGKDGKDKTPLIELKRKGLLFNFSQQCNQVRSVEPEIMLPVKSEMQLLLQWHLIRRILFRKHERAGDNISQSVATLCNKYGVFLTNKKRVFNYVSFCLNEWQKIGFIKSYTVKNAGDLIEIKCK